jgi:hypothetical protein
MHNTTAPFILALGIAACTSPGTPTLEDLVELNTAARGGAAPIEAVQVFESDIRIVEPEFSVDGHYVATRDGRMRVDILADGERVFTEALGPSGGWSWTPDHGVAPASTRGAAALRHGIELPFKLFGLHELHRRGHVLASAGRESIGDTDYHVLTLRLDDGFEVRYYLHPETGLIERDRQLRALHVDVDPLPQLIETEYSDYRRIRGVLFPHRQVERAVSTGEVLATVTILSVRINRTPEPDRFSPPS